MQLFSLSRRHAQMPEITLLNALRVPVTKIKPTPCPPPQTYRMLDDGRRQWVAENRLRDCTPQSMLATMTAEGLSPQDSHFAINQIESNPIFLTAREHQKLLRKLESVVANQQRLWETDPNYTTVEKRETIPKDEFVERYVRGRRPVVLTGITADWPAMRHADISATTAPRCDRLLTHR